MNELQQSAQEKAYERIRDLIISGKFPPGSRLRERDISDVVGFSRTPIREALQRLDSEGLVRSERNRGMFVEKVDITELMEAFDIGASLESRCARLAARRRTDKTVDALEANMEETLRFLSEKADEMPVRYIDLDTRFHEIIGEAAGNRRLRAMAVQAINVPVLLASFKTYSHERFVRSMRQHGEILEAIRTGDEEWADVAMRNHILASRNTLSTAWAKSNPKQK